MPSSQRFARRELHHSGRRNPRMTGRPTRTSLADVHLFGLRRLSIANPSAPTIAPPPIASVTVRIAILLAISRLNWAAGRGEEMTGTSPKAGPQAGPQRGASQTNEYRQKSRRRIRAPGRVSAASADISASDSRAGTVGAVMPSGTVAARRGCFTKPITGLNTSATNESK